MDNQERAMYGVRAMSVGTPDYSHSDAVDNAVDTVANVLHAMAAEVPEIDARTLLANAIEHYLAENANDGSEYQAAVCVREHPVPR